MRTYNELLESGIKSLKEAGIEESEIDAAYLLFQVARIDRASFFLLRDTPIDKGLEEKFLDLIKIRKTRKPLSYILKSRNFMGFDFYVDENVLIPEPETEILVEEVLKEARDKKILDLCTGSGCIAISIALLGSPMKIIATDISYKALDIAKRNANQLIGDYSNISFLESDLYSNVNGKFDIIVSNPPYIETEIIDSLEPEVKNFFPRIALDGGIDGLDFYRKIISKAHNYLTNHGKIFLEIGYNEATQVSLLLKEYGFCNINIIKDYSNLDRIVIGHIERN